MNNAFSLNLWSRTAIVKILILRSGYSFGGAFLLEINIQQEFRHRTHLVLKLVKLRISVLFGEWAEELLESF